VPTRIEKLRRGDVDALFLAAAGVTRLQLDLSDLFVHPLMPREFIPAPAQGVLAYQTLAADVPLRRLLQGLHHSEVSACTNIERKVLKLLGGGCHLPLGVYCERDTRGFYHAHAAFAHTPDAPLSRVRYSSATTFGMAEAIVAQLNEHA
jgi:hydroxymethylbilane synthase